MRFRLTYAGALKAHKDNEKLRARSLHVHSIRKTFHKQLKLLWAEHPALRLINAEGSTVSLYVGSDAPALNQTFESDGFRWLPIATTANGLICQVDVLMLRHGQPGNVLYDIDNRMKTLFDALRRAKRPTELGADTQNGIARPEPDEDPFYVVLEDDSLITHLSVKADTLLEPVPDVLPDEAVRLVVDVTIKPYRAFLETVGYV